MQQTGTIREGVAPVRLVGGGKGQCGGMERLAGGPVRRIGGQKKLAPWPGWGTSVPGR